MERTIGIIDMLGWQRRIEIVGFRSCGLLVKIVDKIGVFMFIGQKYFITLYVEPLLMQYIRC